MFVLIGAPMLKMMFICAGNTCRSQMAEGFARHYGRGLIEAHSAGVSEGESVHPLAVKVMLEAGIDISARKPRKIDPDLFEQMDIVITLCSDRNPDCPARGRNLRRLHIPVEDPARFEGTEDEKLAAFRSARDDIEGKINSLLSEIMGL